MCLSQLPIEIGDIILGYLPRDAKQQCLRVCKAWYRLTFFKLNRYIQLESSEDIMVLYSNLLYDRIKGSDIRCLSLCTRNTSDRYIAMRILNECTNLQVLCLKHDSNQFLEYMYQSRDRLPLESLKTIFIPFNVINRVIQDREYEAIFHYCNKITQLSLNVDSNTIRSIPGNMDLGSYLRCFILLKSLSLQFDHEIVLHDILSACPRLETLRLLGSSFLSPNARLVICSKEQKEQTYTQSQLRTLITNTRFISQDLLDYLSESCSQFHQLTLCGSLNRDTQKLMKAFDCYENSDEKAKRAPILKCLRFERNFTFSNDLIRNFANSFHSSLKRLELAECDFSEIVFEQNNIVLDFTGLELEYLSIDIQYLFQASLSSLNKTSLEIVIKNNETMYFQRKSKWKPDYLFERKETYQYKSSSMREKRINSAHTCVLTIMADSIHYVRLYCQSPYHATSFSQIIDF